MKDEQFVNEVRNILAGKFSEIPARDKGIIIEIGKILFEVIAINVINAKNIQTGLRLFFKNLFVDLTKLLFLSTKKRLSQKERAL